MPGAVDDEVALDVAGVGAHADDLLDQSAGPRDDLLDRDPLDDADAEGPRAARQAHREVDGVDPAVAGHVEAREEVVGAGQREELGHLPRADLLDLEPVDALEGRDPAVLLQAVGVGGRLDEPDRLEAGGHARLRLEPGVEVAGVEPQARARLARGPEAGHQAGGVPRRARGEAVALEDEHVGDPQVGQVVGDGGADDASTDDDDARPGGERGTAALSAGRLHGRGGVGAGGVGRRGGGALGRGGAAHRPNLSVASGTEKRARPGSSPWHQGKRRENAVPGHRERAHRVLVGPFREWLSGGVLLSHTVTSAVPSALKGLASGFGMGPGVSPSL